MICGKHFGKTPVMSTFRGKDTFLFWNLGENCQNYFSWYYSALEEKEFARTYKIITVMYKAVSALGMNKKFHLTSEDQSLMLQRKDKDLSLEDYTGGRIPLPFPRSCRERDVYHRLHADCCRLPGKRTSRAVSAGDSWVGLTPVPGQTKPRASRDLHEVCVCGSRGLSYKCLSTLSTRLCGVAEGKFPSHTWHGLVFDAGGNFRPWYKK